MKLKLTEKRQETEDVFSFIFQPEEPVSWKAGQFAVYKIPHDNPDNRGDTRIFTISSPAYQKQIMLTTRFLSQGGSSFKKALFGKIAGDWIELLRIQGHFTVEDPNKKMVFIAGGIGITPFHSILLDLENRKELGEVILIYSNKNEQNIVFKDTLAQLEKKHEGLSIHYIFSPQRCDRQVIEDTVTDIKQHTFYLSGPTRLVGSVEDVLKELGVKGDLIKKDYLPGIEE